MATASVTNEFAHEFEAERTNWFRTRFLWYTGLMAIAYILFTTQETLNLIRLPASARLSVIALIAIFGFQTLMYPAAFFYVLRARRGLPRRRMIRLVFWLLVTNALLGLPVTLIEVPLNLRKAQREALLVAFDQAISTQSSVIGPIDASASGMSIVDAARLADGSTGVYLLPPAADDDGNRPSQHARPPEVSEKLSRLKAMREKVHAQRIVSNADWDAALAELPPGLARELAEARETAQNKDGASLITSTHWIIKVMLAHLLASCFIPWTRREAIMPLLPALGICALSLVISGDIFTPAGLVAVALSPLIGLPGIAVVSVRNTLFLKRFTYRAIRSRYVEMRRELGMARQIHEDLFPPPIESGPVWLRYYYQPMRHIGGDYLHARVITPPGSDTSVLHLAVMDVTGHGISAALTVNRLHGEIDRILAENPQTTPGQMLIGLNRYMHATLAGHSVYATAICLTIDPARDELRWASAGHPPAFLRQVNGRIDELHSTTFVLGVTLGDDFDPDEQKVTFRAGDALIAYTDGAIECRHPNGQMLGVSGLMAAIAALTPDPVRGWPTTLATWIRNFSPGPTKDDILLVELKRPVPAPATPSATTPA